MRRKIILVGILSVVFALGFSSKQATAQIDPHFSQYYAYPLWLNPGLTGVMNGKFRLTANYKRQWVGVAHPFATKALSFDGRARPLGNLSLGGTILDQSAGSAGYNYFNALASAAYRLIFDEEKWNILSIGLQVGGIGYFFNQSKLQSGSQWNPATGFDPGTSSGEVFDKSSSIGLDANVGVFYYNRNPNISVNPFLGLSVYHLSRPSASFLGKSDERLPMRINIHGGAKVQLNPQFSITPQLLYLRQGNAQETLGSLYMQYALNQRLDFIFGASYRVEDAIIPFAGFRLNDFTLGLSYDANASPLKSASLNRGGLELSLSYTPQRDFHKLHLTCPRF